MICEKCGFDDGNSAKKCKKIIKFGKYKGVQRYLCKNCGHTFSDNSSDVFYKRNTRKVLALLLNMLENNFFEKRDLDEAIKLTDKYYEGIRKIRFITKYTDKEGDFSIGCFNPKLLICEDDKNISFIQIPPAKFGEDKKTRNITIMDQEGQGNMITKNEYIKSYIKQQD